MTDLWPRCIHIASLHWLPLFSSTHILTEINIVLSRSNGVGMLWSQLLLTNRQSMPEERLGFCMPTLTSMQPCQVIEAFSRVEMLWSQLLFANRECSLEEWLGLGIPALLKIEQPQVVKTEGYIRVFWS